MSSTPTAAGAGAETDRLTPPRLEDLARRTARTLLLPYIINYAATHGPSDEPREVAVIVNPRTGSLTMIDGDLDGSPLSGKEGLVPASKESIDSLPAIEVGEEGFDCAICLSEFEIGEEAKQMPCKHKYHPGCIEKWLGIQGSCPVCRFRMPKEENEEEEDKEGEDVNVNVEAEEEEEAGEEEEEDGGEGEMEEEEEDSPEERERFLALNRIPTFVFHIYFAGRTRPLRNPGGRSRQANVDNGGMQENETIEDDGSEASESGGEEEEEEEEGDGYGSAAEDMDVDVGSMDMDVDRIA
ncbi:OLC1v1009589C1 [Oldenlandia corymbosa var. corymbosa]|uniref:RING-type E3 ubiquitin transferase n=1 Tax=Oldenlandia corymbosa var. corymbosa TaxID=529605 RepID=A0AAV1DPD5_OLDCO|nr:OLC1v1009589C1 [Oldenlandia corymbosa var. corymbosa]